MELDTYAVQVLLESSLSAGTVLFQNERYLISKAGWFLLNDSMARVNMDFIHDVCYQGLFELEKNPANRQAGRPQNLRYVADPL